jgi:hypothetical protein
VDLLVVAHEHVGDEAADAWRDGCDVGANVCIVGFLSCRRRKDEDTAAHGDNDCYCGGQKRAVRAKRKAPLRRRDGLAAALRPALTRTTNRRNHFARTALTRTADRRDHFVRDALAPTINWRSRFARDTLALTANRPSNFALDASVRHTLTRRGRCSSTALAGALAFFAYRDLSNRYCAHTWLSEGASFLV